MDSDAPPIGRARHSETERPYDLVMRDGTVQALPSDVDNRDTWLAEDWPKLAPSTPLAGDWLHYKDATYTVHGQARTTDQADLVIYTSSDGRAWLRPAEMWQEHVTAGTYAGPRFRRTHPS